MMKKDLKSSYIYKTKVEEVSTISLTNLLKKGLSQEFFVALVGSIEGKQGSQNISVGTDSLPPYEKYRQLGALAGYGIISQSSMPSNMEAFQIGIINYEMKNEIEKLSSKNQTSFDFPNSLFYHPETVLISDKIQINENQMSNYQDINYDFISTTTKEDYLINVVKIRNNIKDGDVYELNYCLEFTCNLKTKDLEKPEIIFERVLSKNPNPFSAFVKFGNLYCLCFSMERFLAKRGNLLFSQPIKGTVKRDFENLEKDQTIKKDLSNNIKELAENTMITDLVRNDLARCSKTGTITVPDFCEVYSFPFIHQMISTVEGQMVENITFEDILKRTFPMGSMTGAPKIAAMEIIDEIENFKRGLYSGSIGYISPDRNFDFNVVIRSIFINSDTGQISVFAGSAITYDSNPEDEYNECLLKANSIIQALGGKLII